jgi:hypothetical protein
MTVPTQGSRKGNSYTKRGLHTSCEPRKGGSGHVGTWRERGDSDASERSEARGGGCTTVSWPTAPRTPGRRRSFLVVAVAKSGIYPQCKNRPRWDRARACKRARCGSLGIHGLCDPRGSQSDVKFLAKLATTGKRTQSRASMHARRKTRAPGPILTSLRRPDPAWLTGSLCNRDPNKGF